MRRQRKGILRMRPGHLANFSGGAGYMPFVVIYSVPASFLCKIVGSIILHLRARAAFRDVEAPGADAARLALTEFMKYAHRHLIVCAIVAAAGGVILFAFGSSMVYGSQLLYAPVTVVLAAGPFVAWFLSTVVLVRLIYAWGPRRVNLLIALGAYVLMLVSGTAVLALVSYLLSAAL